VGVWRAQQLRFDRVFMPAGDGALEGGARQPRARG